MDLKNNRYIIVELIPTKVKDGIILQLSAIKLNGLILEDRFDYRVDDSLVPYPDLLKLISYDIDKFTYVKDADEIMKKFQEWSLGLPLLFIDNVYTENYLRILDNEKIPVLRYFDMEYSDDCIDILMDRYHLESSNYIVDLLYESLMQVVD